MLLSKTLLLDHTTLQTKNINQNRSFKLFKNAQGLSFTQYQILSAGLVKKPKSKKNKKVTISISVLFLTFLLAGC